MAQAAFHMLRETQQLPQNRENLQLIEESLDIMNNLVEFQPAAVAQVIEGAQDSGPGGFLNFTASVLADINGYSEGLDPSSDTNRTLSVQSM